MSPRGRSQAAYSLTRSEGRDPTQRPTVKRRRLLQSRSDARSPARRRISGHRARRACWASGGTLEHPARSAAEEHVRQSDWAW